MTQLRVVLLCMLASVLAFVAFCIATFSSRYYDIHCLGTVPPDPVVIAEQTVDRNNDMYLFSYAPFLSDADVANILSMKHLRVLSLSDTQITAEQLHQLATSKTLVSLTFRRTNITVQGLEALGQLQSLRQLSLQDNQHLADEIAGPLSKMPQVVQLELSGHFTDAFVPALSSIGALEDLTLNGPGFTDAVIDSLIPLKHLRRLRLRSVAINGVTLSHLAVLRDLTSLSVVGSGVSDPGLAEIAMIRSLRELDLTGNKFSNDGLAYLKALPLLTKLDISSNRVTASGLKGYPALENVYLDKTDTDDSSLAAMAGMSLHTLHLRGTAVTGSGLAYLSSSTNSLLVLNLAGSSLNSQAMPLVASFTGLVVLDLQGTDVQDNDMRQVAAIKSLANLTLADTAVTDAGLAHLAALDKLKALDIRNTSVTDLGLKQLESVGALRDIRAEGTSVTATELLFFTEVLPDCAVKLK